MTDGIWRKLGLVFGPSSELASLCGTHAQVPTALVLEDRIRVYFAYRPKPGMTLPGYVDLDLERPDRVIAVGAKPLLELGAPGSFDEHGIMPSSVVQKDGMILLYYSGWCRLAGRAPYHNTTGLAISEDGGLTFRRLVLGPVLDRTPTEPFSATSPWVSYHNSIWSAFYSAGLGWIEVNGKPEHVYDIRRATSADGIRWRRGGQAAIAQSNGEEALTRPSILWDGKGWRMWFCYRGSRSFREGSEAYRIGFACSPDLITWKRDDAASGIDVSAEGWDSEMIAYPCVVQAAGRTFMFYNGNGFGVNGFGLAIFDDV